MKILLRSVYRSLFLLILASSALMAQENRERDFEIALTKGQYEIELGNVQGAIGYLEKALKLKPGHQEARVSLGIALARAGDLGRARYELQQAADTDPKDGRARYELALVMEKLGDTAGARAMMARAAEVSRDDDLRAAARGFLHDAEEPGKADGASLRLSAGMQYDSNVILEQDSPIAPSPEGKSDWRAVIVANGTLPFLVSGSRGGEASYQFYQSLHLDLEDYNIQQHTARLGGHVALSRTARFDLAYEYIYSFVGGEKYSTVNWISPRVTFSLTPSSITDVHGSYAAKRFFNTPVFTYLTEKDGNNTAIGAVHSLMAGKSSSISFSYTYDKNTAKKDYWAYTGHRLAVNALTEAGAYTVFAGVSYYDRQYEGVPPGASEKRHDGAQEASVGISRKAGKKLTVSLSDTYTFNDSNLALFEYTRNILGLFVEMTL